MSPFVWVTCRRQNRLTRRTCQVPILVQLVVMTVDSRCVTTYVIVCGRSGVNMRKFFLVGSCSVGSWAGWWLGSQENIWMALLLSALGAGIGIYFGRKFMNEYMD